MSCLERVHVHALLYVLSTTIMVKSCSMSTLAIFHVKLMSNSLSDKRVICLIKFPLLSKKKRELICGRMASFLKFDMWDNICYSVSQFTCNLGMAIFQV